VKRKRREPVAAARGGVRKGEGAFQERVYGVVRRIPRGKVASYGMVALLAGRVGAARAVGRAMRNVPAGHGLPCHRVIKSDGSLTPEHVFRGRQRGMLKREGVVFRADGRVDMGRCEWDGQAGAGVMGDSEVEEFS
jgi:methylated-DNA-protein-cysteine methyltransferase-like protein